MKRSVRFLMALLLSGVVAGHAAETGQDAGNEEPEEIIIRGTRSVDTLRIKMMATELRIYDLFNTLNPDDRYDIHCQVVAATGSLIKERQCAAQYIDDIRADEAWAYESDLPWIPPMDEIERHDEELRRLLEKHLAENKDLQSAAREYRDLRKQLLEAEQAREKN
ncbi:MAG: hypothetical protein IT494_08045 [Gammaproteobacteria bacterium]|nr:hypothetical protein [Gammaproteobacteria bacterium]